MIRCVAYLYLHEYTRWRWCTRLQHIPLFVEDEGKDPASLLNQQLHSSSVGNQFGTKHTVRNVKFEEEVRFRCRTELPA